jgi:hypothetical protein
MRWQWWQSLSAMAEALTALPKTSAHRPIPTFVVTMVDLFSYLLVSCVVFSDTAFKEHVPVSCFATATEETMR